MRKNTGPWFWAMVLACAAVLGCQTVQTTQPGTVGVSRQQHVSPLINSAQLNQQAALQYRQVLGEAQKKTGFEQGCR